jgi:hypothetical protein
MIYFKVPTTFIVNNKYAFCRSVADKQIFVGILVQITNYGIRFKNVKGDNFIYSSYVINRQNTFHFYELDSQKQKIQDDMENRALHLILRRLIGDEYFTLKCKFNPC